MKKTYIFLFLLIVLALFIFKDWFFPGVLSSGDLRVYYPVTFKDFFLYPNAWDWSTQNGLGGGASPLAWIYYDLIIPLHIGMLFNLSWPTLERIFFLCPFLVVCFCSPLYLFKQLFPKNPFWFLGSLIYLLNTYIFMMVGGGQIVGISMAYAIFPLVLLQFIRINDEQQGFKHVFTSIIAGLVYALLSFFDLRFAYMLMAAVFLFFIVSKKWSWKNILFVFVVPLSIAGFLHAFWILPVLMSHQNPTQALGSAYNSIQSVQYFSFAKFENSISLLHPYWPENIFGKISFMKPEFLVMPIIAFSALFFINNSKVKIQKSNIQVKSQKSLTSYSSSERSESKNLEDISSRPALSAERQARMIIYFCLLGLIGAFLAKGATDPFGGLYIWMFAHIPGFVMFRDPTKWYTLVAVSYSVLIPFTIWNIYKLLISKLKIQKFIQNLFVIFFIFFWFFTIRQAVFGQLSGTFRLTDIPTEYVTFANYLSQQPQFYRTLWVPSVQRFALISASHPPVSAQDLLNAYDEKTLVKKLKQPGIEKLVQDIGVKYVIVPTDSEKEIFLNDRTYSDTLYDRTVADVSKISWLKRSNQISGLAVFEIPNPKDLFWSPDSEAKIQYAKINPDTYKVTVTNAKKSDRLVFAESFDPHWVVIIGNYKRASIKYDGILNSFVLPQDGNYEFEVYYTTQKWVNIGVGVSAITLILVIGSLLVLKRKL